MNGHFKTCIVQPQFVCSKDIRAHGFYAPRKCGGECGCQQEASGEELPVALPVANERQRLEAEIADTRRQLAVAQELHAQQQADARRVVAARLERSGSLTPNLAKAAAAIKFADQAVKFPPKDEQ